MDKALASALVWLRRDLRALDNAALYHACRDARRVWCVFVFDRDILDPLPRADRRVEFIHESVRELDDALRRLCPEPGGGLIVCHGRAQDEIPRLAQQLKVQAVYANHDDDPAALTRDAKVRGLLADVGVAMHTSKDHVIFERSEVMTQGGTPYGVFTPYKRAWLSRLSPFYLQAYPVERHAASLSPVPSSLQLGPPALSALGFETTNLKSLDIPTGASGGNALFADFMDRIGAYEDTRNFPAVRGPSYLSVHLRFGTVSVRALARSAHGLAEAGSTGAGVWLSELIWRDFYHQVLHHHPHVVTQSFKPEYDRIQFEKGRHAEALFETWCEGRTGYPLVDAAMAQINQTGYMHNRLRMITASFLVKDLGIDWRWGERYFAEKLNDYDLAPNNGGWQWASSSGCDAQPYFRIFNPVTQSEKFDPGGKFIRRYLPMLGDLPDEALHAPWKARAIDLQAAGLALGEQYPHPVVQHDEARERTLARYAVVKATASR